MTRRVLAVMMLAALAIPARTDAQVRGNVYLKTVRVTAIPGPPSGDWWDGGVISDLGSTLGAIFSSRSPDLYPDIEICVGTRPRQACRLVCVNAQLNADDPARRPACGLRLDDGVLVAQLVESNGQRQWAPRDLMFDVNDVDETGFAGNRRLIGRLAFYEGADPPILQPDRCSESEPCTRSVETERGPLMMAFTTVFAGVVGTPQPPSLPGAPTGTETPAPAKPVEPSYYDRAKQWLTDFIWDKAKEPAGFRGTVIEGLAEQARVADNKYAACLVRAVKTYQLEDRLEKQCSGKSGDTATSCAYQIVAEDHPDVAQKCQTGELTFGFLANLWKSACGLVGMTCN